MRSADMQEASHRRVLFALVFFAAAPPPASAQENYPEHAIRIVVPTAPGGPSDIGARLIAQELTKRWGRQVVVDTRPGAGSIIGTEIVSTAAADGYTLLLTPSTRSINLATKWAGVVKAAGIKPE